MLGSEGAIARVVHRLQTGLPGALQVIRERYDTTVEQLPDVRQYLDFEPDQVGIDQSPSVHVVEGPTRARQGGRRIQAGPARDGWAFTYTLRVFLVVRGDSYQDTHQRSRRIMLAMRETLIGALDYPATPDEPNIDDDSFLEIQPTTLQEDFSAVGQDRSGRSMRASFIQCEWSSQEWITAYPPPTDVPLGQITPAVGMFGP